METCPGVTVDITDKPAAPKGRLAGGKQVLAEEVRGLLGATAAVGRPAVTAVSTASEVSSETGACWAPDEPCSLKRDRSFSSKVLISSIRGALG